MKYSSSQTAVKRKILLIGLFLIAGGLIANEWVLTTLLSADGVLSPRSVIVIWLVDITLIISGITLVLSRSYGALFEVAVGVGITILLIFGAEKVFYRLNHLPTDPSAEAAPAPPISRQEGSYTQDFFESDALLGYVPQANTQVDSVKRTDDNIIYNVIYSIDAYHRRITPVDGGNRSKSLLFFGGSFVFGEGLDDNETLPYQAAQLAPDYKPYNYGVSGFGPQQMLAKLQSNDLAEEAPEADGVAIYVFIDGHVERAIGSMYVYNAWGDRMPYYTLDWRGNLIRKRDFRTGRPLLSTLYETLGKSEIAKYFKVNIPSELTDRHYAFTARIIAEARDTFKAKYGSDEFYVLIYPDEGDYFEDMQPHFEEYGLKILNYDERMKLDPDEGLAIVGDGHPTGRANQIVAGWIVEDLGLQRLK